MKNGFKIYAVGLLALAAPLVLHAQTCTVDWTNVHQPIDGFGASSAWNGTWTASQADLLFSTNLNVVYSDFLGNVYTNNGIGLSLLRNRILYASSTSSNATPSADSITDMVMAQARGARIWSTPWTPPAGFKSVNDIYDSSTATGGGINGGSFLGGDATNQAYAWQLANYVAKLRTSIFNRINLYAISIQNEPDAHVTTYEACQWSSANIHNFVTNLYNALAAKGVSSTKIMLPESQNWLDPRNLAGPAMTDSNVAADVGIIACHNYDGANGPGNLSKNSYGKALWETEVAQLSGEPNDITNGVYYARRVFLFMTAAQANAWSYWWVIPSSSETGFMTRNAGPTKRMFAVGNYSRFVRPGYYRIDVTNNTASTLISAYNDTNSGNFAIVAVNPNSTDVTQLFNLTNFPAVSSVTPWITSGSLSLASQPPVLVANSSFSYLLPAFSVVTFVGRDNAKTPPYLAAESDQIMDAGQTLLVTNTASDPNVPPQNLTFSLLNGPAGATLTMLDTTNAQFSWRAPVSLAGTTNPVSVAVTDTGTSLSATNSYNLIVNPLSSQPTLASISTSGGQVTLVLNGPQGPDYTVLTSTNVTDPLSTWQALLTTNSPITPVTLMVPTADDSVRFYSIQIGP
jgi:glucuronoarabinoxylan endo-1,4-beta-xylanase